MLTLNGLRISEVLEDDRGEPAADVVWRVRRRSDIPRPSTAGPWIGQAWPDERPDGTGTVHIYGHGGRVACRFRVSPTAAEVDCCAVPDVTDRDLHSLFVEPVMRTILVRKGRLSFHAAALVRDGRAVLIAADKGAGKSTLSWALQQQGWQLFADDLSCVAEVDGRWSVYPGHRQTKLAEETTAALGYADAGLPSRFDENPAESAHMTGADKRVMPVDTSLAAEFVPITAFLFLRPRDPLADGLCTRPAEGFEKVRLLIDHTTRDPLARGSGLSPELQTAIGRLTRQVVALNVTLPDSLRQLAESAAAIEALVPPLAGARNP